MKPIPIHPLSFLGGLAVAALVAALPSATQTATPIPTRSQVTGIVPASWWMTARLFTDVSGTPLQSYVVPADRYLVLTNTDLGPGLPGLRSNGVTVAGMEAVEVLNGADPLWWIQRGSRIVIEPGSILTADAGVSGQIWGYLEPAR